VAENVAGQRSAAAVLSLDVLPEVFPPKELAPKAPFWAAEPLLLLGPAVGDAPRFAELEIGGGGPWVQTLLLWHQDQGPVDQGKSGVKRMSSGSLPSLIDVFCYFRHPGSSQVFRALLAEAVSESRLQVALPPNVPMSLRLAIRLDDAQVEPAGGLMSEPLSLLVSENCELLRPAWDIWTRHSPDGAPPRWSGLPEAIQSCIEASWLEGQPK
ncbi:unnamed protein product, partial [Polarella glacialis]